MELLAVIGLVICAVIFYFFLGVALKFLWGWWILIIATPLSIFVGIEYGWWGAFGGIIGFLAAVSANNEWHDTKPYLAISDRLDKAFYFKDV